MNFFLQIERVCKKQVLSWRGKKHPLLLVNDEKSKSNIKNNPANQINLNYLASLGASKNTHDTLLNMTNILQKLTYDVNEIVSDSQLEKLKNADLFKSGNKYEDYLFHLLSCILVSTVSALFMLPIQGYASQYISSLTNTRGRSGFDYSPDWKGGWKENSGSLDAWINESLASGAMVPVGLLSSRIQEFVSTGFVSQGLKKEVEAASKVKDLTKLESIFEALYSAPKQVNIMTVVDYKIKELSEKKSHVVFSQPVFDIANFCLKEVPLTTVYSEIQQDEQNRATIKAALEAQGALLINHQLKILASQEKWRQTDRLNMLYRLIINEYYAKKSSFQSMDVPSLSSKDIAAIKALGVNIKIHQNSNITDKLWNESSAELDGFMSDLFKGVNTKSLRIYNTESAGYEYFTSISTDISYNSNKSSITPAPKVLGYFKENINGGLKNKIGSLIKNLNDISDKLSKEKANPTLKYESLRGSIPSDYFTDIEVFSPFESSLGRASTAALVLTLAYKVAYYEIVRHEEFRRLNMHAVEMDEVCNKWATFFVGGMGAIVEPCIGDNEKVKTGSSINTLHKNKNPMNNEISQVASEDVFSSSTDVIEQLDAKNSINPLKESSTAKNPFFNRATLNNTGGKVPNDSEK